jgi:hypothetical protein
LNVFANGVELGHQDLDSHFSGGSPPPTAGEDPSEYHSMGVQISTEKLVNVNPDNVICEDEG